MQKCSKCGRSRPSYIYDPTCPSGGYCNWRPPSRWLWAALFFLSAGCGGAPFEGLVGASDSGAPEAEVDRPDVAPAPPLAEAGAPALDGSSEAAANLPQDAALPPTDACAPVTWQAPPDGSAQGPFKGCVVDMNPAADLPEFYAVITPKAAGCFLERTPLACLCAADSCACLKANTPFCQGTCDESLGAPVLTCN